MALIFGYQSSRCEFNISCISSSTMHVFMVLDEPPVGAVRPYASNIAPTKRGTTDVTSGRGVAAR